MLEKLCMQYTNLDEQDIKLLISISEHLPLMANLMKADVFIDCMTRETGVAIVVAEAKPSMYKSMYKETVVGEYAFRHNEPAAVRTLELGMPTRDLRAITQEEQIVKQNVVPIKNDRGVTIACLIVETDVYDKEKDNARMQILSETTEQLTESLMNAMNEKIHVHPYLNDGVVIFDRHGFSQSLNPVAVQIYRKLGYLDELVGIPFENLVLDGSHFEEVLQCTATKNSEVDIGSFTLKVKYASMKLNNSDLAGIIMIIKDITGEKAKEKELISKSVAMREIHHRVKNNLQTIASLLKLQSRRIENKQAQRAFDESINRVISIAVTHEVLAQKGVDDVDIKTILDRIITNATSVLSENCCIDLQITGDSFVISSDLATSIALVVNELVQNSMQYAFVGREKGRLEVKIQRGIQYSSILVTDDGVGYNIENAREGSLGMKIVKSIINDKLKGCYSIDSNENGTKVSFDFKMKTELTE
ncbi:MAG: sensor histidine kinase [Clostridia bacterium]|nr:sensor histidine kinase [Clostridia bacterium]